MLRQDFSVSSLLRVTTLNEIIKFSLGRNKEEYKKVLQLYSKAIEDDSFELSNIKKTYIKSKAVYFTESPEEHYVLKKISADLNRLYKIKTQIRDDISEQIFRLLETSSDFGLIRVDVKSFYESIVYEDILLKLNNEKLLSSKSLTLLNGIAKLTQKGLPRGLSISPVISEIYMRDIDTEIKRIPGVYYFSRYVDDIFVITTKNYESTFKSITECLSKRNLKLNNKTFCANIPIAGLNKSKPIFFDYLGYKYNVKNDTFDGKRVVNVTLSSDKVRKIKTRIIHSLLDRSLGSGPEVNRVELLKKRIEILSGNYPISFSKGEKGQLKGGVFYSNRLVNKAGVFEEFNTFLKRSIYSNKGNFFGRAMKGISITEKEDICKISFKLGFINKKYIEVNDKEMKVIKSCWLYQNYKKK